MNSFLLSVSKKNSVGDLVKYFQETLTVTNRDFKFLTDWKKIEKVVKKYRFEIALFDVLIKSYNFDNELRQLLSKYPDAIKVLPLLLALSNKDSEELVLVEDFLNWNFAEFHFNFREFNGSSEHLDKAARLFEKTGLKNFFLNLSAKSILDYTIGVQVGLDTNARKNRSGHIMEKLIEEEILSYKKSDEITFEVFTQKKFKFLKEKDILYPNELSERKADFLLVKDKNWVNIEVNFYNTSGSKPEEIVNAYTERQRYIKNSGGHFVLITDGLGWRKKTKDNVQNQVKIAFKELDYIMNLHFVKEGYLLKVLKHLENG